MCFSATLLSICNNTLRRTKEWQFSIVSRRFGNANAKSVQNTGRAIAEDVKDEVQDISEEIGKKAAEQLLISRKGQSWP
jgi:hypothetical protein